MDHRSHEWFGRNLRAYRHANGLSQRQLSKKANIHHLTIHKVEHNRCSVKLRTAVNLSYVLGVTVDQMCTNPRIIEEELCKLREMSPGNSAPS